MISYREDDHDQRSHRVVTPNKGIMSHWRSEIDKFAPHLKVCYYDSISAPLGKLFTMQIMVKRLLTFIPFKL